MGKVKSIVQDFLEQYGYDNYWSYENVPSSISELERIKEEGIKPHDYYDIPEKEYFKTGRVRPYKWRK